MSNTTKPDRDAFSFSLGGMTTIASFVVAPAIADDRLRQNRDDRLKEGRRWLDWMRRVRIFGRRQTA